MEFEASYLGIPPANHSVDSQGYWNAVLLKHDCMYRHNIMRINYTSYDVRRCDDVIHTGTSGRCNIMVLNPTALDAPDSVPGDRHPFWYAQVLGIYHANVIYIGEGNLDYRPWQLEFLWVRWYELDEGNTHWSSRQLDHISFPAIAQEHSFAFLDPSDVIRACHLIPAFEDGQENIGPSFHATTRANWKSYVVNQWVTHFFLSF